MTSRRAGTASTAGPVERVPAPGRRRRRPDPGRPAEAVGQEPARVRRARRGRRPRRGRAAGRRHRSPSAPSAWPPPAPTCSTTSPTGRPTPATRPSAPGPSPPGSSPRGWPRSSGCSPSPAAWPSASPPTGTWPSPSPSTSRITTAYSYWLKHVVDRRRGRRRQRVRAAGHRRRRRHGCPGVGLVLHRDLVRLAVRGGRQAPGRGRRDGRGGRRSRRRAHDPRRVQRLATSPTCARSRPG